MSESYNILGITIEQIDNLTENECKQVVMSGTGLLDNEPRGRILTKQAFEMEQVNIRINLQYKYGLYRDNLYKGSQRTDKQDRNDLVVAIFSFLEDKVVATIPMMSGFEYFQPVNYFGSGNRYFRISNEIGSDKISYTYKEFLYLLMALDDIRNVGRNNNSSNLGLDFFKPLLDFPITARNLKKLNYNVNNNNISEMTFLTFTHSIKMLGNNKTLYRLKFGSEDTPTFAYNYERDGVEGFGYRLKGTFLLDIVFDGDVVTDMNLYRYSKPLTIFNNFNIVEDSKEEINVLTSYLQKYVGKTYKELRDIEIVTDLRLNGLQEIANTEQGRVFRQYLKLNVG